MFFAHVPGADAFAGQAGFARDGVHDVNRRDALFRAEADPEARWPTGVARLTFGFDAATGAGLGLRNNFAAGLGSGLATAARISSSEKVFAAFSSFSAISGFSTFSALFLTGATGATGGLAGGGVTTFFTGAASARQGAVFAGGRLASR